MNAELGSTPAVKRESEYLSAKGREIRDKVRAVVPLIRKNALAGERAGMVPEETLKALQPTELFLISVPIEHGGYALGARDLAEILIEVGRGDASMGWIAMIASGHTRIALTLPDKAVAEIYAKAGEWLGPTMAGGSLFSEKIQKAEKAPGGVIVKAGGKWIFASGCKHAQYTAVGIDFVDEQGNRQRGMALLERHQYQIVDDWHVMGLRASSSNSVATAEDVFVPEHRFLDLAEFPKRLASFSSRFKGIGYQLDALGLMLIPALEMMGIVVGAAKAGYEALLEQVKSKKPFNLPYASLSESVAVQVTAAKIGAMIRAGEGLLLAQADWIDRKAMAREAFTQLEESQAMMDIVYAGNMCGDALDIIQKTIGSSTVSDYNAIQRLVRDARVVLTHGSLRLDPVAEIHGRQVMGLEPFAPFGGLPGVKEKPPGAVSAHSDTTELQRHQQLEANTALVQKTLSLLMNPATLHESVQYIAPNYIQHNPNLESGRDAIIQLTQQVHSGEVKLPETAGHPICITEGDLVVSMLPVKRPDPQRPNETYLTYVFDMWRIENGQLAEHWDSEAKNVGDD